LYSNTDYVSGGLKVSVKKTRAPADLDENLDDRNVPAAEPSTVPPGFLSPSVKEYLELGKSIPGNTEAVFSNMLRECEYKPMSIFPVYHNCHAHSNFPVGYTTTTVELKIFKYGYPSEGQKCSKPIEID
jgi:hypothetical protein